MDKALLESSLCEKKQQPLIMIAGAIGVLLLICLSVALKVDDIRDNTGAPNIEASYHALLTIKALDQGSANDHFYLPSVSLAGKINKGIPWGATIPGRGGNYIYTSYPSPGFVVPLGFLNVFNLEITLENLANFNFFLGAISSLLLYFFLFELFYRSGTSQKTVVISASVSSVISIFSYEAMLSHGIVYWSQSLSQVILVLFLFLLLRYFKAVKSGSDTQKKYLPFLLGLAFLMPYTEWTGYIFNTGVIFCCWFKRFESVAYRHLAFYVLIFTFLAGIFTILHYCLISNLEDVVNAFYDRFFSRNLSKGSFIALLYGYVVSYSLFLVAVFVGLFFLALQKMTSKTDLSLFKPMFLLASFPLLENVIMLQHASQFSFDRLKLMIPLAMLLSLALINISRKQQVMLTILIVCSAFFGHSSYMDERAKYLDWNRIDKENKRFAKDVASLVDPECAVYATNNSVRGYINLLFDHGIYEWKSYNQAMELTQQRDGCASVYIKTKLVLTDLPQILSITLTNRQGQRAQLKYN